MKIALDLGHVPGSDASGVDGLRERMAALNILQTVRKGLITAGHQADVLDFPTESNSVDLRKTARAINDGGYNMAVSFHCDASESPFAKGAHVCYVSKRGKKLAQCIGDRLRKLMPGRAEWVKFRDDLYILNKTICVAVLVELGFVTNEEDHDKLLTLQSELAEAIVEGILEFINSI